MHVAEDVHTYDIINHIIQYPKATTKRIRVWSKFKKLTMKENELVVIELTRQEFESTLDAFLEKALRRLALEKPAQNTEEAADGNVLFINKREAAKILSVCVSTIDNHANAGHLTRYNVGKSVRFDRKQVLELAKGK